MIIKRFKEFPEGSGSLSADDIFLFMDNPDNTGVTKKISLAELTDAIGIVAVSGASADTEDITFSGSTISTANTDQSMTITTNGSGNIYIDVEDNIWQFTNEGNLNLPEGKVLNFGQNIDTLGPPVMGGGTDRVRLWDFKGTGSDFNYAIGAEGNHVWFAMDVNNGTGGFKFYSRDNEIFKISDDSKLVFPNNTTVAQGTFDNSTGGQNGISLNCYVGYELNWQGGHLKSTADGGLTSANIWCDSPIEFIGSGIDNVQIDSSGITFSDGTTQNTAGVVSNTGLINGATPITNIVKISQANYDALGAKDPDTLYFIV
jgi:hypothetical protein